MGLAGGLVLLRGRGSVHTVPLERGPVIEAIYGLGTVTARRIYRLQLGVESDLKKVFVREGDRVQAGAPLVQLGGFGEFRAPFGGTITQLPFKEGENVFRQVPIVTLVDLRDRFIEVSLEPVSYTHLTLPTIYSV